MASSTIRAGSRAILSPKSTFAPRAESFRSILADAKRMPVPSRTCRLNPIFIQAV
jgi:hypothetical protein